MKHSSRKAWSTINNLTSRKNTSSNPNSISPNAVALYLLKNGNFQEPNRQFTRGRQSTVKNGIEEDRYSDFLIDVIISAIKTFKPKSAPGQSWW